MDTNESHRTGTRTATWLGPVVWSLPVVFIGLGILVAIVSAFWATIAVGIGFAFAVLFAWIEFESVEPVTCDTRSSAAAPQLPPATRRFLREEGAQFDAETRMQSARAAAG